MMFQMVYPVSRDELVIHYALEELVELLLKLRIMMVSILVSIFLIFRFSKKHLIFLR